MKILYSGDSPTVHTGFGIVSKNIVSRLKARGHDVAVLGVNFFGDPYDTREFPYPIYPVEKGTPENQFGFRKLWAIAESFKPNVLFFLNDPWIIHKYMEYQGEEKDPYMKTIGYFPIDAGPLKPLWAKTLTKLDAQVCYSEFGERIVREANGKTPKNLSQVYHGVDKRVYRPINQLACRRELGLPEDSFIVGMVARNQFRKRFDILVSAFAKFAADKPNAKLYLHTALKDIGFDIKDLVEQFGIGDKLILTEDLTAAQGVPESMLNMIYNSFDVNVLLSLGDGFGLPVAESMATGCPQLVSDHSCLRELVNGHGGLTVKTAAWIMHTQGLNTWGGVPDENDVVDKLNLLYHNKDLRVKLAEDGYKFITQDKFDWDYIVDRFEEIINETMHILPRKEANHGTTDTAKPNVSGTENKPDEVYRTS